jgi:hypothetical protein
VNVVVSATIEVGCGGALKTDDDCFPVAEAIPLELDGEAGSIGVAARSLGGVLYGLTMQPEESSWREGI